MKNDKWALAVATTMLVGAHFSSWAQSAPATGGVYTCIDAKGRKLTADRPITECTDREQKILNPSGTVREKVSPTLTAQERADRDVQEKRDMEERNRLFDEKRRDRALLIRYPNKGVHDQERREALIQIGVVMQAANNRLEELSKQRVDIDAEMEFYKKDPNKAPAYVRRQLDENTQSQAVQRRFIGEQEAEVKRVSARFDEELVRLRQLWSAAAPSLGK
jgi:serine phosphatase RsbU (regulator of sigma subunit)